MSNDQSYKPVCVTCDEHGVIRLATTTRWEDALCEDCAQHQDEASYERMLDDFYGGAGASGITEQMSAAYALDRSQR